MHALQFSRLFSSTFAWAHGQRTPNKPVPAPPPLMGGNVSRVGEADVPARSAAVPATEAQRTRIFMATLAHELRNTMAPLGNALEILGGSSGNPQLAARALPVAQRQLQHMSHLVDDMLDMGRVLNDRLDLELRRVSVQDLVAQAVQACTAAAEARGHLVRTDLPAEPLCVDADPVRFGQVMANLLGNAIKFTPAGGHIGIAARQSGNGLELRVSDDGVGISADELPAVFDLFRQEASSKQLSNGGLGIGLALVRRLVELHGGKVEVHSDGKGRGTVFTIRLPLAH